MKTMVREYAEIDRALSEVVAEVLQARGVPTGLDSATRLADSLYPDMLDARAMLAARERSAILKDFTGVIVPDKGGYSMVSLRKLTYRASGLGESAPMTEIEVYDSATQREVSRRVAPYTMPDDEQIIEVFKDRMVASMGRHARGASRDLVIATARDNRLMWARELAGAENCGWCAMLASRGAVYSERSVRFRAHNHCDCTATLVADLDSWGGLDQAAYLSDMWNQSSSLKEFTRKYRDYNAVAP